MIQFTTTTTTMTTINQTSDKHHPENYQLPDPPLTDLGYNQQCHSLRKTLESHPLASKISLIVISPMRRTLQTATQSLSFLLNRPASPVPVHLSALFQENSAKPCDTGSHISKMAEEWPQYDWSVVDPAYPSKEGIYEFSEAGLLNRGVLARKFLRERKEEVIAVVSHAGFLRIGVCKRRFENADFRVFDFESGKGEGEDWALVEREETYAKGGGMGLSPIGVVGVEEGDRQHFEKYRRWKEEFGKSKMTKKTPVEEPSV